MNKIEELQEKISEHTPGSSKYHFAAAEWCFAMSANETDEEYKKGYKERGELHKLMGETFSKKEKDNG